MLNGIRSLSPPLSQRCCDNQNLFVLECFPTSHLRCCAEAVPQGTLCTSLPPTRVAGGNKTPPKNKRHQRISMHGVDGGVWILFRIRAVFMQREFVKVLFSLQIFVEFLLRAQPSALCWS